MLTLNTKIKIINNDVEGIIRDISNIDSSLSELSTKIDVSFGNLYSEISQLETNGNVSFESVYEDITTIETSLDEKQATITENTDLTLNSITTNDLNVGGVLTYESLMFDTIVLRRQDGYNDIINLRELQLWINGVNILPVLTTSNNVAGEELGSTTEFFNKSTKKTITSINDSNIASNIANNNITNNLFISDTHSFESSSTTSIYIPLATPRNVYSIQAIVLYNRSDFSYNLPRAIGLRIELYNKATDQNLSNPIASTNTILTGYAVYRYDFPAIDTYTSFVGVDSIDYIVNDAYASKEVVSITRNPVEINTDLSITGDTTIAGTLGVTGATTISGELQANGGFKCDTDRFVVENETGNTTIAGTLGVTGLATFSGGISGESF